MAGEGVGTANSKSEFSVFKSAALFSLAIFRVDTGRENGVIAMDALNTSAKK
jgi:hypothetical protein